MRALELGSKSRKSACSSAGFQAAQVDAQLEKVNPQARSARSAGSTHFDPMDPRPTLTVNQPQNRGVDRQQREPRSANRETGLHVTIRPTANGRHDVWW